MALSNVSFSNSIGSFSLLRSVYSIKHTYKWSGVGEALPVTEVTVNGTLKKSEYTSFNSITGKGDSGNLILPHKIYDGMKLVSIQHQEKIWAPWGSVSITFTDEDSNHSKLNSSVTWWGYTVYNPVVNFNPGIIRRSEEIVPYIDGVFRQELGFNNLKIGFSGTVYVPEFTIADAFIETFEKEITDSEDYLPIGHPYVFDLSEAIPQTTDHLDINNCTIAGASITWNFERHFADFNCNMIAAPQSVEVI